MSSKFSVLNNYEQNYSAVDVFCAFDLQKRSVESSTFFAEAC